MQFIERNSFNVRSAVYHLKKEGSGPDFLLFPMVLVGSRDFYANVSRRLATCDLILAESVKSKKGNILKDLASSDEILAENDTWDQLDKLIVDERDRELIARIRQAYEAHSNDKKLVGTVYGAFHMRNVMRFLLSKLHYKVTKAEWVIVFEL